MADNKKTGRTRGANRPLSIRLQEAIETAEKRVTYHEKHLSEAQQDLKSAKSQLASHEAEERETAEAKIAEYEAELKRLKALTNK